MQIRIVQWREVGDYEDCLTVDVAEDNDTTLEAAICEEAGIEPWDGMGDYKGLHIETDISLFDNEVLYTRDGRQFRLTLTEITNADTSGF